MQLGTDKWNMMKLCPTNCSTGQMSSFWCSQNSAQTCCCGLMSTHQDAHLTFCKWWRTVSFGFPWKYQGKNSFLYSAGLPGKTWKGDDYSMTTWGRAENRHAPLIASAEVKINLQTPCPHQCWPFIALIVAWPFPHMKCCFVRSLHVHSSCHA